MIKIIYKTILEIDWLRRIAWVEAWLRPVTPLKDIIEPCFPIFSISTAWISTTSLL